MENSNEKVVGYVLKGYGRTSETFISNEIELLEQAGLKIRVFSMKRLSGQASHGVTQRIGVPIEYLPEVESGGSDSSGRSGGLVGMLRASWPRFSASHLRLMRARPLDYLSTLARVIGLSLIYGRETGRAFVREFLQAGVYCRSGYREWRDLTSARPFRAYGDDGDPACGVDVRAVLQFYGAMQKTSTAWI
jgi:hypothetical protein